MSSEKVSAKCPECDADLGPSAPRADIPAAAAELILALAAKPRAGQCIKCEEPATHGPSGEAKACAWHAGGWPEVGASPAPDPIAEAQARTILRWHEAPVRCCICQRQQSAYAMAAVDGTMLCELPVGWLFIMIAGHTGPEFVCSRTCAIKAAIG